MAREDDDPPHDATTSERIVDAAGLLDALLSAFKITLTPAEYEAALNLIAREAEAIRDRAVRAFIERRVPHYDDPD